MFIKLCKDGCHRIVAPDDTVLINKLTAKGFSIVCDKSGKPVTFNKSKFTKAQVENNEAAAALAKLNDEDKTPVAPVAPVVTEK